MLIFIHIGKCSGTAIRKSLENYKIKFKVVHHYNQICPNEIIPRHFRKKYKKPIFLFCIRNPIDRIISSFYFKYKRRIIDKCNPLPKDSKKTGCLNFNKEIAGLNFYKTIENLAINLYNEDDSKNKNAFEFCSECDHISYGLDHYLKHFFYKNHNIKIIRHEFLKEDYKKCFDKDIKIKNVNYQPNIVSHMNCNKIEISQKAYDNLKKFLKKDFEIIEKLADRKLISKEYKNYCINELPEHIIVK
jgi:hypothetical protein